MNTFERALEILDRCGWAQGEDISRDGERCLVQAWEEAEAQLHPWRERPLETERRRFARVNAHRARHDREEQLLRSACADVSGEFGLPLWRWNDDPRRSEEDVRLALKYAAQRLA